jgi:hypothetical protein
MRMRPIRISGFKTGTVHCRDCIFFLEATHDPFSRDIQGILADGAMHAMIEHHHVIEHIVDDRTVDPITMDTVP